MPGASTSGHPHRSSPAGRSNAEPAAPAALVSNARGVLSYRDRHATERSYDERSRVMANGNLVRIQVRRPRLSAMATSTRPCRALSTKETR